MFNRLLITASALVLATATATSPEPANHNFKPKDGYVPNASTAIKIAVAVWEPIYGAENIFRQKPYVAQLVKGTWIVQGTLPGFGFTVGGTAIAEISKDDGKVSRVRHGK